VSAARRIARLEGGLGPPEAMRLWLDEAHAFGSLAAYVAWLVDQPLTAAPLVRVPEAAIQAMKGQPRDATREAVRDAIRDGVFKVVLVLELSRANEEAIGDAALRYVALCWELRAIQFETRLAGSGATGRLRAWRASVSELLVDLLAAEEARGRLEARYLEGRAALFPNMAADWRSLRKVAERLAEGGAARPGGSFTGRRRGTRPARDLVAIRVAVDDRAPVEAAVVADTARAATLEILGASASVATTTKRRLRATGG
jgi:hypothetical protein